MMMCVDKFEPPVVSRQPAAAGGAAGDGDGGDPGGAQHLALVPLQRQDPAAHPVPAGGGGRPAHRPAAIAGNARPVSVNRVY